MHGPAWPGSAGHGMAGRGGAGPGWAGRGEARQGKAWTPDANSLSRRGQIKARQGMAPLPERVE
jgi:hypothetical protein